MEAERLLHVVVRTNKETCWDYVLDGGWEPDDPWTVWFGDVDDGCGTAKGRAGWQDRVPPGSIVWWMDSTENAVYAQQETYAWPVDRSIPARGHALAAPIEVRTSQAVPYYSLGYPSLSIPRLTVVELKPVEARRWVKQLTQHRTPELNALLGRT